MSNDNGGNGEKKRSVRDLTESVKAPALPLKCAKCGTDFKIHAPRMVPILEFYTSGMMFANTHSLDERICPGCGTGYAPAFQAAPKVIWVPVQVPEVVEASRIIKAVPDGFNPMKQRG